jgi:hypothetical protein
MIWPGGVEVCDSFRGEKKGLENFDVEEFGSKIWV